MAYRDIEMWKQILESEDLEKKAYENACAKRTAERAELDEKDFWECDQKEIDPATLTEIADDGAVCLEDVEDIEEDVDFSGYADDLSEADMREPLTKITAALGAPASTANLAGQDTVKLAEAINRLADLLEDKPWDGVVRDAHGNPTGEKASDTNVNPDKYYKPGTDVSRDAKSVNLQQRLRQNRKDNQTAAAGCAAKYVTEDDVDALRNVDELPLDDADWDKIDGLDTVVDKVEYIKRKCEGVKLSKNAQDELDAVIDGIIKDGNTARADAESKQALEDAKKFYDKWLDDPDFREQNALKDKDGATVKKAAGWYKRNPATKKRETVPAGTPDAVATKGEVIAGTDPESEGAQLFKSYFDKMNDVDRAAFETYARSRMHRFTAKNFAPFKTENPNKKGTLHGKDGEDDENVNPLAQHGLDQVFNAGNAGVEDDPDAGDEFYPQVDQDAEPDSSRKFSADSAGEKTLLDVAVAYAKRKGMYDKDAEALFRKTLERAKIANTVMKKGREDKPLTDYQMEYIFSTADDKQLEELKQELLKDAGDNRKERDFIDYLFRTGKQRHVTMQDLLKQYGIAGNQGGKTGGGTQNHDAIVYAFICALAEYYGVMQDETAELWRVKSSQNQTKRDKELGVEPRRYARHLACLILQDLFDELHDYQGKGAPRVVVPQSPKDGPKIRDEEWKDVQRKLGGILLLIKMRGDNAEFEGVLQTIKNKIGEFHDARQPRKLKTFLTDEQNEEFQRLLELVRNDFARLNDDDKIRILQLDRMRLGDDQNMALGKAEKALQTAMNKNDHKAFDEVVKRKAKAFLAGGSNNMNRDGIRLVGGVAED